MDQARVARLIGAVFGLVFVLVNAGAAPGAWGWLLRLAGVAGFVAVLVRLRTAPERSVRPRPGAIRVYWACVAAEVVAIVVGVRLLASQGHGELGVALVAAVVGMHFVPFAWAFAEPSFAVLGAALLVLGIAGAVVGTAAGSEAAVALVAGVGSGLALLGYGARDLGSSRRRGNARRPGAV